jgi:uncharacterized membrane protein YraQ (UPF0718 family)
MSNFLETFWGILLEISPFVILGMLAAGLVHEGLTRYNKLRSFALKRNFWSLSFFNFAGFTLPICSCGVVPLAVALKRQGVPFGNLFSFVYSAPATSIAAVILSIAVLGLDFTLFYVVGALLCGYAVGAAFYLVDRHSVASGAGEVVYLCDTSQGENERRGFFVRAFRWGTVTYGSRIAVDLLVGLSLAALLVSLYPVQSLGDWMGELPFWKAAILMLAIAIPLYVCSLPGIMVGGALVLGGFTPALVWVFLMAGPVTNLGDMNVMRRNLGLRHTLLYVAVVVTVTFLWGWIIYANLEWSDVWSHTREYYATNLSPAGFDGEIAGALANPNGWGMPREVHYAAVFLLLLLTLNGVWLAMKEFWVSPCLHCAHFQQDLRLNPAICRRPCWKSRLIRSIKRRNPTWRSGDPPAADVECSGTKTR